MCYCLLHGGPHFDDLLKCEGVAKHHGPLGRDHLLVNGVVEMSHLKMNHQRTITSPLHQHQTKSVKSEF